MTLVILFAALFQGACTQGILRPPVWGIAKTTFLVSDFQVARNYYGDLLGFDEAFFYTSDLGKVISFKVNDRQFLKFVEDKDAKEKPHWVSVSFEAENVEQMREYLLTKGIKVPVKITKDGAGNQTILVYAPSGVPVEFIKFRKQSLHKLSEGKYLSEKMISKSIYPVIPFIETNYRVIANKNHRDIAGLSMGGTQTQNITNFNPGTFSDIGVMSSGLINNPRMASSDYDEEAHKKQLKALQYSGVELYWIGCGKGDYVMERNASLIDYMMI